MHDDSADPAKEAVEHLQNAALEMVRATRAFLDLAEELLADPGPLLAVADVIGGLAAKGRAMAAAGHGPGMAQGQGQPGHSTHDEPAVQHIRVS